MTAKVETNPEIDFTPIVEAFSQNIIIIVLSFVLFGAITLIYASTIGNQYTSEALIMPTEAEENISKVSSSLSSLASLAGVGKAHNRDIEYPLAVLQSREFLTNFVEQNQLTTALFSGQWDEEGQQWRKRSFTSKATIKLKSLINNEKLDISTIETLQPSAWQIYQKFKNSLSITTDRDSGYITIKFTHSSPELSANITNQLVESINNHIKQTEVIEAERNIKFLLKQINETNVIEMKEMLFDLIESNTRTIMLANARSEYVFKFIDLAIEPTTHSYPNRLAWSILGAICGSLLVYSLLFYNKLRSTSS